MDFIENVVRPRLRAQIAGAVMATEMTRPKSYSYHSFILEGYVQLAMMADKFGINLWDMSADTGNSMLVRAPLALALPYMRTVICIIILFQYDLNSI